MSHSPTSRLLQEIQACFSRVSPVIAPGLSRRNSKIISRTYSKSSAVPGYPQTVSGEDAPLALQNVVDTRSSGGVSTTYQEIHSNDALKPLFESWLSISCSKACECDFREDTALLGIHLRTRLSMKSSMQGRRALVWYDYKSQR